MEISNEVQRRINYLNYSHLERLAQWCWNRYWGKDMPPIAHYITRHHYHLEEGKAGLL